MVMCCGSDKLDLLEVYGVLRKYTDKKLTEDRRLGDLGIGESVYWLEIFNDLKIPYVEFTSGGTLTNEGRKRFYEGGSSKEGETTK